MELLRWDGSLAFGLKVIDEEHKKLTDYINRLYEHVQNNGDLESLTQIFDELMDYTIFHFNHEEVLFMDSAYPESEQKAHIREHETLKEKLLEIRGALGSGDKRAVSHELLEFMIHWLTKHTETVDSCYVPYLKAKEVT